MQHLFSVVLLFGAVFTFATADFRTEGLALHNKYRSKHGAPPLKLSDEVIFIQNFFFPIIFKTILLVQLNDVAQDWANTMAKDKDMKHRKGNKYGENVYSSSNKKLTDSEAVIDATNKWFDEGKKYNYRRATFTGATGHFTQVVWKSSKYLGIGVARSDKGVVYVCANYDPRGNMMTQFLQNVLRS